MRNHNKKIKRESMFGFTLIELMVSIAIISFLASVALFNYSSFNDRTALGGAAQEVAIAIRQAEIYGVSASQSAIGSGDFNSPFGIYFSRTNPSHYYIFADKNANEKYDPLSGCGSGLTECIEEVTLRNNIQITNVCDATPTCPPDPVVTGLSVTYIRPNPDARIRLTASDGSIFGGVQQAGKVVLVSPQGNTLSVRVENTGQISIE